MRNNDTNKVLFVSLGCDKNLVDSEEMLGALQQRGFVFTDDEEEADAAIVNTCCFIMDAQKESIDQILALAQRRTEGQLKALIVTGCMAQRYKDEVLREIPEVDAVIGTTAQDRIAPTLEEIIGTAKEAGRDGRLFVADQNLRTGTTAERIVTTGGYYSYLKIAEGCDKCCTYCVIPSIRGRYRSTPMEELISQGCGIIIPTQFGYLEFSKNVAERHPDVAFYSIPLTDYNGGNFSPYIKNIAVAHSVIFNRLRTART